MFAVWKSEFIEITIMNTINTVGICGAGTMGRGIALACIQSGYTTFLYDVDSAFLEKSIAYIHSQLDKSYEKGKLSSDKVTQAKSLLHSAKETVDFAANCDIIIEAIVENLEIKEQLIKSIESNGLKESAILASNTSSLSINVLASKCKSPENFIGLHFFNPANLMKLVEIIRGNKTDEKNIEATIQFVKNLGKTPVIARDVPGFIVNRVARNYYNEAMRIATEGVAEQNVIDKCMKEWGFKMGPFELMDLIGNDINLEVTKSVYAQYFNEPRFSPSLMQQDIVNAGTYGRKTGQGFYSYKQDT